VTGIVSHMSYMTFIVYFAVKRDIYLCRTRYFQTSRWAEDGIAHRCFAILRKEGNRKP
jgi:hypothetical protein